jgi:hypothetical protein
MTVAFNDILGVMQEMSEWSKNHQIEISEGMAGAWDAVKVRVHGVWTIISGISGVISSAREKLRGLLDVMPDWLIRLGAGTAKVSPLGKVFKEYADDNRFGVGGVRSFPIDSRIEGYNDFIKGFKKGPPKISPPPADTSDLEKEIKRIRKLNKDYWDALAGSYDDYTRDPDAARMSGMQDAQGRVAAMVEAARAVEDASRASFTFISEEMLNAQNTWVDGALAGLAEYQAAASDTFQGASDFFGQSMNTMEDFLVDFVTSGKLEFKDLIDSILSDLARLMIRQMITGPLANALAGGLSGLFGGGGPHVSTSGGSTTAFGMATGGIASGPSSGYPALLHGTEAVVPLSGGRSIPVELKNGGGDVQVVVNNNSGQQASVSETQTGDGMRQILVTIGNDIRRMGPTGQAIGQRFGLTAKGMA